MIRSPFFYVGDKYKIFPQIKREFPTEISAYYEPFLGGGSSLINVEAEKYIVNDLNEYMIKLHLHLREKSKHRESFFKKISSIEDSYQLSASYRRNIIPENLRRDFKKTYYAKFNKESYIRLRQEFNRDKSNLDILYLLLIYGFNRMLRFNKESNFNLPVGNVDLNSNVINSLNHYFDFVSSHEIDFSNMDYFDFLNEHKFEDNDFIYLDPPYLISSSEYNKLWNEDEEKKLLMLLDNLTKKGVRWAISNMTHHKNNVNDIFLKWSKKYNVVVIKSNYISYHDNSIKNKSREVLVKNYE